LTKEEINRIELYIKGEAVKSDKDFVESLFLNGENNPVLRYSLEKDWDQMSKEDPASEPDLSPILDHIHHLVRKRETIDQQRPFQKLLYYYSRIAAILLIPVIIAGILTYSYFSGKYMTNAGSEATTGIYAPMGSRVSFSLPDGTTGMLNSASYLEYTIPFQDKRQVKLTGEAFFKVKSDENNPFVVSTGNSTIKVTGTIFNLSSYPSENYLEVVLQEGKVEFMNDKLIEKVDILPSERLVFIDGRTKKSVVDPDKYNAWTEGKLVFRGDLMSEVARRIEKWYNIRIVIADSELEKYSFRGTFEDDSLEDVLKFLAMTSPISYSISPREILQDGSVKKEVVTIYSKHNN
jgi:ferric-dicitrate binding protein FerR (iron transport regulator)